MPVTAGEYEIRKNDDGTFDVVNTKSGKVHSSHTSEDKAKHQKQLLYAVGHGWEPSHEHSSGLMESMIPARAVYAPQPRSRVSTPKGRTR